MIRRAVPEDLTQLMEIVAQAAASMRADGFHQWDATYPDRAVFAQDIAEGALYVIDKAGRLGGMVCIDAKPAMLYRAVPWRQPRAAVLHRLAVRNACRGQGLGRKLVAYACRMAGAGGYQAVHSDTARENRRMRRLFAASGFCYAGAIQYPGYPETFYCYEKPLSGLCGKGKGKVPENRSLPFGEELY